MPRFPSAESEIVALAQAMVSGLNNNANFPTPPVTVQDLGDMRTQFMNMTDAALDIDSESKRIHDQKDEALRILVEAMRKNLRYAVAVAQNDDAKLKKIGWSSRAVPTPLEAPGQCGILEGNRQNDGTVALRWIEPKTGGKAAAYQIQRRERATGTWQPVGTAYSTAIVLGGQPRNVECEYCVIAGNKAGDGPPSNAIVAVL